MMQSWRIGVAALALIVMADPATAQQERYAGPIIDVHVHAYNNQLAPRRFCFPQPCEGLPSQVLDGERLLPETLRTMDELNIVLGVASSSWSNVRSWVEGNEDRFVPAISIGDPANRPIDMLRRLLETDSLKVLGEISSQYQGVAADDPRLDPIYALAVEFDVPVHIHVAGLGGSEDFPTQLGNPQRLAPVLAKYPGLRIYLENAAWPYLEEVTSLMYQYPTVHADISTILHLTPRGTAMRYLQRLVENGLAKRLMFGSDQMSWPEVMAESVEAIQHADFLSAEQKADIFYHNAARFFELSEEEVAVHWGR